MSVDLETRQSKLPEIRLKPIEVPSTRDESRTEINGDADCVTPTSSDQKIPLLQSCPPAPKKRKSARVLCKRKLSELQFFELTAGCREEVDAFFRNCFVDSSSRAVSRKINEGPISINSMKTRVELID